MSISLNEDFRTVAEYEQRPREILEQIHRTGRPVVLTVRGKPDVVMIDAVTFERRLMTINLAHLLATAEKDVRAGRIRSADEFLSELRRGKKVSR